MNIEEIKNTVINADCLEVLKALPDKCVDLVLTDPPYGIGDKLLKGGKNGNVVNFHKQYEASEWVDVAPPQEVFEQIFRVSKNQIIFGGNYFNLPPTRGIICWDKNIGTPYNFSHWEMAWTSFDMPAKKFTCSNDQNKEHPTQKPLPLIEWCLGIADGQTKEKNMTVLDCFLGSGTTAVACYRTRRNFIGIEINEKYCEIARKRLQDEKDKLALFPEERTA